MLAPRPPMGWNSWDCYGAAVTEEITLNNARVMADRLLPYGYDTVVVDIQWARPNAQNHDYEAFTELTMDAFGRLQPAVNRFPSSAGGQGFRPLADRIHAMGLKFGIHIMRGIPRAAAQAALPIEGSAFTCAQAADPYSICQWNPDMYGARKHSPEAARAWYDSIFRQYAAWGVDFVKCDDIAREYPRCEWEIECISRAARSCGRDMVLSLSPGPAPLEKAEHLKKWANMWRITDDFWVDWRLLLAMFERAEKWCIHAGPGHWPDADMLPVGAVRQCVDPAARTRFTPAEQRCMMTLWCMMRSPLMIGGDLQKLDGETFAVLCNAPLLAVLRESFAAHPVRRSEDSCLWMAADKGGRGGWLALFNLSDEAKELSFRPAQTELRGSLSPECWGHAFREEDGLVTVRLEAHDAACWRIR